MQAEVPGVSHRQVVGEQQEEVAVPVQILQITPLLLATPHTGIMNDQPGIVLLRLLNNGRQYLLDDIKIFERCEDRQELGLVHNQTLPWLPLMASISCSQAESSWHSSSPTSPLASSAL